MMGTKGILSTTSSPSGVEDVFRGEVVQNLPAAPEGALPSAVSDVDNGKFSGASTLIKLDKDPEWDGRPVSPFWPANIHMDLDSPIKKDCHALLCPKGQPKQATIADRTRFVKIDTIPRLRGEVVQNLPAAPEGALPSAAPGVDNGKFSGASTLTFRTSGTYTVFSGLSASQSQEIPVLHWESLWCLKLY